MTIPIFFTNKMKTMALFFYIFIFYINSTPLVLSEDLRGPSCDSSIQLPASLQTLSAIEAKASEVASPTDPRTLARQILQAKCSGPGLAFADEYFSCLKNQKFNPAFEKKVATQANDAGYSQHWGAGITLTCMRELKQKHPSNGKMICLPAAAQILTYLAQREVTVISKHNGEVYEREGTQPPKIYFVPAGVDAYFNLRGHSEVYSMDRIPCKGTKSHSCNLITAP